MTIINSITSTAGRGLLHLRKASPYLLTGGGVVGVVTAAVMACKATLKLEETVQTFEDDADSLKVMLGEDNNSYTVADYKKDRAFIRTKHGLKLVKLYGPSVTLGVASVAAIVGGQGIMHKRNVAIAAAYKSLEQGFAKYRERIEAEHGADADFDARYGKKETTVETDSETGHQIATTAFDVSGISVYARFFDETNQNWQREASYNAMFVKVQQKYANDLLQSRGHVFLNEVYDSLGMERTKEGQIVGWVKGNGDDFIDFGLYDGTNERAREFVNGFERSILLDFNVDGVVFDLI